MELILTQTHGGSDWLKKEKRVLFQQDTGEENQVLNLYPQVKGQQFDGFGCSVTDASGMVFSKMYKSQKKKFLSFCFDPGQMSCNRIRIPIDSCDFSPHMHEAVKPMDESLSSFSMREAKRYILPFLEMARACAKDGLKLMLSPWSPPSWMKTNKSRKGGGSLKKEYYPLWAEYICRYIKEYQSRGYEVERISIQNEPGEGHPWDSCTFTDEEEKIFLRDFLYSQMEKEKLSGVEVFIWDDNKERVFERVSAVADGQTEKMIAGAAVHWQSGDHFEALDLVQTQYPDMKLILSESCLPYSKIDKERENRNAMRLAHDMIGDLNHGICAFYGGNILLNQQGGPNHGGNFCDAPFLYDEKKKNLMMRKTAQCYWHFSCFIKPGARRIAHTCYTGELDMTAWENPTGELVFVLLNRGGEKKNCVLRLFGKEARFSIEGGGLLSGKIL